jgi:hypothetical protein
MGQRVEYEALLGSRYDQYLMKLRVLFGFLTGPEGGDFKAFRNFTRKNGLWDKEKSVVSFSLVDITWDRKAVTMGKMARRLEAEGSDDAARDILYEHMKAQNILLVKYVLEALDVESGGRLHSVHELYRMVTSYVYPGDYITLPNFQSWIEWMAATGYIKMVGIRWALSEKGLEAVGELKAMDVEEILEDLEEEGEEDEEASGDSQDDWGVPETAPTTDPVPAAATPVLPAESSSDTPAPATEEPQASEEEWYDTPPEAKPPTMEDIEAAEASFMEQFADMDESETEEPATVASAEGGAPAPFNLPISSVPAQGAVAQPVPPSLPLPRSAVVHGGEDTADLALKIVGWWNTLGDWPVLTARELGVEVSDATDTTELVMELAALAITIEGLEPQPQIFAFVQSLREAGYFKSLKRAKSGPQVLGALDAVPTELWMRGLRERLVYMSGVHKRLADMSSLYEKVEAATNPRDLALIFSALLGEEYAEAPFWMIRELVRLGVVTNPLAVQAAVVPSRRLLKNAAAIGLIPRAEVASFEELMVVSQTVASVFGAESGYGEALEVMDRALVLGA